MNCSWFNEGIKPFLKGYSLEYSSFPNGDFGDLERVELAGFNKLATVEFWSNGWVGIDIYDCAIDDQVMSILLSPEEKAYIPREFDRFIKILTQNS